MYLWGTHFYWMCDCIAVKEILEYDGEIHMICRWAQELLGYHYSIIHRCERMMKYVDSISRRFGPAIAVYIRAAALLITVDRQRRPLAYDKIIPNSTSEAKYLPSHCLDLHVPVLTNPTISSFGVIQVPSPVHTPCPPISSAPILFYSSRTITLPVKSQHTETTIAHTLQPTSNAVGKQWLCINDVAGSFTTWSRSEDSGSVEWDVRNMFVSDVASSLFHHLHPTIAFVVASSLSTTITSMMTPDFDPSGMDSMFIPSVNGNLVSWLLEMLTCISVISQQRPTFGVATLWVPCHYFKDSYDILESPAIPLWSFRVESVNSASCGDKICALRTCITFERIESSDASSISIAGDTTNENLMGYRPIIESAYNKILDTKSFALPVDVLHASYQINNRSPFHSAVVAQITEDDALSAGS